jgi:ribosomal protein S4E
VLLDSSAKEERSVVKSALNACEKNLVKSGDSAVCVLEQQISDEIKRKYFVRSFVVFGSRASQVAEVKQEERKKKKKRIFPLF